MKLGIAAACVIALVPLRAGAQARPPSTPPKFPTATAPAAPATSTAPESITFREAITRATLHNVDVRVAADDIVRVEGLLGQARAALLPQVNASAIYEHLPRDIVIAGDRTQAKDELTAALSVTVPIIGLQAYADKQRARDQVEVSAAQAASTRREIAIETARAYFAAFTAAQYVGIAMSARDNAKTHVALALDRRSAGVSSGLDLSRAQSELATDQAQVNSALTSQLRAEQALGVIVGADHAIAAAEEPDLGAPKAGPGTLQRADVIAAQLDHRAAKLSRRRDWTNWTPTLDLFADVDYETPQLDPGAPQTSYEIMLTLTQPIYDGGYRHGLHVQRLALEAEAADREASTLRTANSEVALAQGVVEQTRDAMTASHQAAQLTGQTLELATEGYKAGTSSSLEVVDAQRSARDAALQAVIADNDYRQAELDLASATGAFPPRQ